MKNYQFNIILLFIILSTLAIVWKMDQRVDIHWMLPPHSDCAVKLMYFRDSEGEKLPKSVQKACDRKNKTDLVQEVCDYLESLVLVQEVCHWRHQG